MPADDATSSPQVDSAPALVSSTTDSTDSVEGKTRRKTFRPSTSESPAKKNLGFRPFTLETPASPAYIATPSPSLLQRGQAKPPSSRWDKPPVAGKYPATNNKDRGPVPIKMTSRRGFSAQHTQDSTPRSMPSMKRNYSILDEPPVGGRPPASSNNDEIPINTPSRQTSLPLSENPMPKSIPTGPRAMLLPYAQASDLKSTLPVRPPIPERPITKAGFKLPRDFHLALQDSANATRGERSHPSSVTRGNDAFAQGFRAREARKEKDMEFARRWKRT